MNAPDLRRPLAEMPRILPVPCIAGSSPDVTITPPGSKSLTNRAVLLGALAAGRSRVRGALDADDTRRMVAAVRELGAGARMEGGTIEVDGVGGAWRPRGGVRIDAGGAGTVLRFLAAAALRSPAPVELDGDTGLRERPMRELGDALGQLGAAVEWLGLPGRAPLRVTPPARAGSTADFATAASGQFLSALLLAGPWLPDGITVRVRGAVTSRPYVAMTLALLARLGAAVRSSDDLSVMRVAPDPLDGFDYAVEPDATAATYWWAAAAILPGARACVPGLCTGSLQGDACFGDLLEEMGAEVEHHDDPPSVAVRGPAELRGVSADMSDAPDAAPTLAAVACFASGTTVLRGLRTLRVKETDRLAALQVELAKVGVRAETPGGDPDALHITPPPGGIGGDTTPVEFNTYGDHRMAMSLALIGLRRRNVAIRDPACVGKTYPRFWSDLETFTTKARRQA